jgi:N-acetylglucosaminyldiphosphoundecaprenol N-acetyl-beta-D-mannosaminyltransferase
MMIERINILGIHLSAINMQMALEAFDTWITRRACHYVCVTGVHGVMESQNDASLRNALNGAGLVTPDGMPMVWVSRLRGYKHVSRVYGPDLMLAACERSLMTGWKHFLYGGMPGVPERLAQRLSERYPGVNIVGIYSPPFEPLSDEQELAIANKINDSGADIVWVGLGMPKQEKWMASHRDRLNIPVLVGVGAAFDFHSGNKLQAPRWMQRSGLEWTFRLATEPRRLWGRYFPNNPKFMLLTALQLLGLRRYDDIPK